MSRGIESMRSPAVFGGAPQPPHEALEMCAADLAVSPKRLRVLPRTGPAINYKSTIFYVGTTESETPLFVIKLDTGAYDPQHEMEALKYAAELLGCDAAPGEGSHERRLGVVRPVGWGADPRFLVTRYQAGELLQRTFDRVVFGWWGFRPLEKAHEGARLMGSWLGRFRVQGARDDGGIDPAAYRDEVCEHIVAFKSTVGAEKAMDVLSRKIEGYLPQLPKEDVERMRRSYPSRGDARPKNFLLGDDGVLYGFDMEGFGFLSMEHDISCVHHALEYDGLRSPAAAGRASALWSTLWAEYEKYGSSSTFALLSYIRFVLDAMKRSVRPSTSESLGRRVRTRVWIRNRLRWLAALTGDLSIDAGQMKRSL